MLVLSIEERNRDDSIIIGDDIEITVEEIRANGTVRIGISAPKSIPVHRKPVYLAIKAGASMEEALDLARPNRRRSAVAGDVDRVGNEIRPHEVHAA